MHFLWFCLPFFFLLVVYRRLCVCVSLCVRVVFSSYFLFCAKCSKNHIKPTHVRKIETENPKFLSKIQTHRGRKEKRAQHFCVCWFMFVFRSVGPAWYVPDTIHQWHCIFVLFCSMFIFSFRFLIRKCFLKTKIIWKAWIEQKRWFFLLFCKLTQYNDSHNHRTVAIDELPGEQHYKYSVESFAVERSSNTKRIAWKKPRNSYGRWKRNWSKKLTCILCKNSTEAHIRINWWEK